MEKILETQKDDAQIMLINNKTQKGLKEPKNSSIALLVALLSVLAIPLVYFFV